MSIAMELECRKNYVVLFENIDVSIVLCVWAVRGKSIQPRSFDYGIAIDPRALRGVVIEATNRGNFIVVNWLKSIGFN